MDDQAALARSRARRGEVIGNNYRLDGVLGIGGMGVVHVAVQRSLERTVAVKLPRPDLPNDHVVRYLFRNEALTSSRLNHRNIVSVLDFNDDAAPYLVMEHIVGPRLGQLVKELGQFPIAAAVDIVRQLVAGLEDAHANGVVHADVKCDNVLIQTTRDGSLTPRLIDFGIARFVDDRDAPPPGLESYMTGTPAYIAPEVARGRRPTPAADVYALGVMLYELVTGTTPFGDGASLAVLDRKLELDAIPIGTRYPELGVPPEVDELVVRMLARDPSSRPGDASELAGLLDATCQHASVPISQRSRTSSIFSTEAVTACMVLDRTHHVSEHTIRTT